MAVRDELNPLYNKRVRSGYELIDVKRSASSDEIKQKIDKLINQTNDTLEIAELERLKSVFLDENKRKSFDKQLKKEETEEESLFKTEIQDSLDFTQKQIEITKKKLERARRQKRKENLSERLSELENDKDFLAKKMEEDQQKVQRNQRIESGQDNPDTVYDYDKDNKQNEKLVNKGATKNNTNPNSEKSEFKPVLESEKIDTNKSKDFSEIKQNSDKEYTETVQGLKDKFNAKYDDKFGSDRSKWTKEQRDEYLDAFRKYQDKDYDPRTSSDRANIHDDARQIVQNKRSNNPINNFSTAPSAIPVVDNVYKKLVYEETPRQNVDLIKLGDSYQLKDLRDKTNQRIEVIGDKTYYLYKTGRTEKRVPISDVSELREVIIENGLKPGTLDVSLEEDYILKDFENRKNQRIQKLGDKSFYLYDESKPGSDRVISKREEISDPSRLQDVVSSYGLKGLSGPDEVQDFYQTPIKLEENPLRLNDLPKQQERFIEEEYYKGDPKDVFVTPSDYKSYEDIDYGKLSFDQPVYKTATPTLSIADNSGGGLASTAVGMAKDKATKKIAGSIAKKGAKSLAKNALANAGTKAATTMGKLAAGVASGGALLAAQAALALAKNTDEVLKFVGGAAAAIMNITSIAISASIGTFWIAFFSLIFGGTLVVSFILIIINTGAYMVPPGDSIFADSNSALGACAFANEEDYQCFVLDRSWGCADTANYNNLKKAIDNVLSRPGASSKICSDTTTIAYEPNGLLYGGITRQGGRYIGFSTAGSSNVVAATYTLGHELGHVLNHRFSIVNDNYDSIDPEAIDGGYLPSYPGAKSKSENLAEAIGLWLMIPFIHSDIGTFVVNYPGHYNYANSIFR